MLTVIVNKQTIWCYLKLRSKVSRGRGDLVYVHTAGRQAMPRYHEVMWRGVTVSNFQKIKPQINWNARASRACPGYHEILQIRVVKVKGINNLVPTCQGHLGTKATKSRQWLQYSTWARTSFDYLSISNLKGKCIWVLAYSAPVEHKHEKGSFHVEWDSKESVNP